MLIASTEIPTRVSCGNCGLNTKQILENKHQLSHCHPRSASRSLPITKDSPTLFCTFNSLVSLQCTTLKEENVCRYIPFTEQGVKKNKQIPSLHLERGTSRSQQWNVNIYQHYYHPYLVFIFIYCPWISKWWVSPCSNLHFCRMERRRSRDRKGPSELGRIVLYLTVPGPSR